MTKVWPLISIFDTCSADVKSRLITVVKARCALLDVNIIHCDLLELNMMLYLEVVPVYLCDRIFQVVYNSSTSYTVYVTCSVPRGSVLGPRLMMMMMKNELTLAWR